MSSLVRSSLSSLALLSVLVPFAHGADVPKTWVDKDTGHRVWRLSDEPNSGGFYFNVNAYTPDGKQMIYTAPDGIHVLDMATRATKLLVANPPQPDGTPAERPRARQSSTPSSPATRPTASSSPAPIPPPTSPPSTRPTPTPAPSASSSTCPSAPRLSVVSVNADETLVAGTYIEGDATGKEYGAERPRAAATRRRSRQPRRAAPPRARTTSPTNKGQMMDAPPRRPPSPRPLHHSPRARPQRREARRHQDPPPLHRLGQPPALLAHRSHPPHVLPRRPVAEGRPHLDDPHRRHPQHPHPQAHHGHGDRRPRVLGPRRRDHLVRLAVPQGRRLLPRRLQPEDRQAHRLPHAAQRVVDSLQPHQGSRPLLRRRRRSRPGRQGARRRVDRALPPAA